MQIADFHQLPPNPGCYLFYHHQQLVYVGKAKNILRRVSQYFQKQLDDQRLASLVSQITNVEYFITTNELEALILEEKLIKTHQPKFNVLFTDDKRYPYIVLTSETYPQLIVRRTLKTTDKLIYGPFPIGTNAGQIVKILNEIFPFRKCYEMPKKVCLYYHLNQCYGPCEFPIDPAIYQKYIQQIDNFFQHSNHDVKQQIKIKMQQASNNQQFEYAQKLLEFLTQIDDLTKVQHVQMPRQQKINWNVHSFYAQDGIIVIYSCFYRKGALLSFDYQFLNIKLELENELLQWLIHFYQKNFLPPAVLLDFTINPDLINDFFHKKTVFQIPQKGQKLALLKLANENAKQIFSEKAWQFLARIDVLKIGYEGLLKTLNLPLDGEYMIEMIDAAHTQGKNYSGGLIHFANAKLNKKAYRHYSLSKFLTSANDGAALAYICQQRFEHQIPQNTSVIFLLDGGKQQYNACYRVIQERQLQSQVKMLAITKDQKHHTHHIFDGEKNIVLTPNSPLYVFLCFLQEEVHRFTISFFRKHQLLSFKKTQY